MKIDNTLGTYDLKDVWPIPCRFLKTLYKTIILIDQ